MKEGSHKAVALWFPDVLFRCSYFVTRQGEKCDQKGMKAIAEAMRELAGLYQSGRAWQRFGPVAVTNLRRSYSFLTQTNCSTDVVTSLFRSTDD